jgi:PAS domain S-box-containing protein
VSVPQERVALWSGYVALFAVTTATCYAGAWRASTFDNTDARRGLIALFLASGTWAVTSVGRLLVAPPVLEEAIRTVGLATGLTSVGAWLYFASAYAGYRYHRRARIRNVALVLGLLIVGVKLSNPLHHLYFVARTRTEPFAHLVFQPRPFYWIVSGVAYAMVAVGFVQLVDALDAERLGGRRFEAILLLTGAPAVLDVVVYTEWLPPSVLEFSYAPVGMAVFAVGTLSVTRNSFRAVPRFWRRQVLERSTEAVVVVDDRGVIRHVSDVAADMFPALADTTGAPFGEVTPELARVTSRDEPTFERERDGTRRHYRVLTIPLTAGRGQSGRAFVYLDVTDSERTRRDLEESERELRRFKRAVEAAGHAVFLTDPEGRIEYVNPAFETITGYSESEVVGETPAILGSGRMDDRFFERMWETITAGEVWSDELVDEREDGTPYYAHQTIAPIVDDDDVEAFVAVQTEVTERRERERQLRVLGRFLRHNLRNDMNVIRGHAELLETDDPDAVERDAELIVEKCDQLMRMANKEQAITDLLLRPSDRAVHRIRTVVERRVETIRERHPQASVDLDRRTDAHVEAVREVGRAVEELLENAVVHSDAASPSVAVTVTRETEHVVVTVTDDGPPIPEMERQVLSGGEMINDLYHGTGLGLWLVYWIVTRSGGRVTVDDADGRGNAVRVELLETEADP